MHDASSGFSPEGHNTKQDPSLAVRPLFVVKPLFAEGRQREDGKGDSSGIGLLLHRPVNEVVKVEDIMSAIDAMLREMALDGYVLPVAQSEVVKTLKDIRSSGRLSRMTSPPADESCEAQK